MSEFHVGQEIYVASVSVEPFSYKVDRSRRRTITEIAGPDSDGFPVLVLDDGMRTPSLCGVDADKHDSQVAGARLLRERLSISLQDAGEAYRLVREKVCPDPLTAAFFVYARGLAIHIKGGPTARHDWQMRYAVDRAGAAAESDHELAALHDAGEPASSAPSL